MSIIRRVHPASFKAQVALEALKEVSTISQLSSRYGIHSSQIKQWKKEASRILTDGFSNKRARDTKEQEVLIEELYKQIGQQKVELDWLKKKLDISGINRRTLIEPANPQISIARQCDLIGLNRASYYYRPSPISDEDLLLMKVLDEQYTRTPFYGVLRMTAYLRRNGFVVNEKRGRRLLRLMGLESIYTKPKLSVAYEGNKIYPYLLRDVDITACNQAWATDLTYIRLYNGFIYLVAIIDLFSRYVLSWEISTTLENSFCIMALENALKIGIPGIFNSDQGSQFTAENFTKILLSYGIRISMDGKGRVFDNILTERLWRSVKYEEVYLNDYRDVVDAKDRLGSYLNFYNNERLHQSLNYQTPREVYFSGLA